MYCSMLFLIIMCTVSRDVYRSLLLCVLLLMVCTVLIMMSAPCHGPPFLMVRTVVIVVCAFSQSVYRSQNDGCRFSCVSFCLCDFPFFSQNSK